MSNDVNHAADACAGCTAGDPLHGRRHFLRTLAGSAAAALLTLGATPAAAQAMELRFVDALSRRGEEARYGIPDADGATVDTQNEVILVRHGGMAYAFSLSCPHQNTALKWEADDQRFHCPKHKSRYEADGTFIDGRATRGMDRFVIRRDADKLVVDLGRLIEQDKDGASWSAAKVALT